MQNNDPDNAPSPLEYDQDYMSLLDILNTDPRSYDESTFWMLAKALSRYGTMLSDLYAYGNEERYAFYVHQTKQKFGKQGCRFPFRNCSGQKGFNSKEGPQKRIYSSLRSRPVVLYQYWIGKRIKTENEGYSLVVVMPPRRSGMHVLNVLYRVNALQSPDVVKIFSALKSRP
jgi:hypothetical protein